MITLSPDHCRQLRASAHALKPVVSISEQGLSPAVMREIDSSLKAHELIKIRVYGDDRSLRETYLGQICEELGAAPVQHIGKLLVIWRPAPAESTADRKTVARRTGRVTKRSQQGSSRK